MHPQPLSFDLLYNVKEKVSLYEVSLLKSFKNKFSGGSLDEHCGDSVGHDKCYLSHCMTS